MGYSHSHTDGMHLKWMEKEAMLMRPVGVAVQGISPAKQMKIPQGGTRLFAGREDCTNQGKMLLGEVERHQGHRENDLHSSCLPSFRSF